MECINCGYIFEENEPYVQENITNSIWCLKCAKIENIHSAFILHDYDEDDKDKVFGITFNIPLNLHNRFMREVTKVTNKLQQEALLPKQEKVFE